MCCINAHDFGVIFFLIYQLSPHNQAVNQIPLHFNHVKRELCHSAFSDLSPEAPSLLQFMHFSELYNSLISALVRHDSPALQSCPASEKGVVGYIKINMRPARVQLAAAQVFISTALSVFSGVMSKKKWKLDKQADSKCGWETRAALSHGLR